MSTKRTVGGAAILHDITAGMKSAELMEKYSLSEVALRSVFEQLYWERESRICKLVSDIRKGLDVRDLASKRGISPDSCERICRKLARFALSNSRRSTFNDHLESLRYRGKDRRKVKRHFFPVLTKVARDNDKPHTLAVVLDISEKGIGLSNVNPVIGETRTFLLHPGDAVEIDPIVVECKCRWAGSQHRRRTTAAGYEIVSISQQSLSGLKSLIRAEADLVSSYGMHLPSLGSTSA